MSALSKKKKGGRRSCGLVIPVILTLTSFIGCANIQPFVHGTAASPEVGLCYDSNPSKTCTEPTTEESPIIKEQPMSFSEKVAWTLLTGIGGYLAYDAYQGHDSDKPASTTTSGDVNTATITGNDNTVIFGGNQPVNE